MGKQMLKKLVLINRPIAPVFDYVAECDNSREYLGSNFYFKATTSPPYQLGTKAAAVGTFAGFTIRLNYVVTEYEVNRIIRLQAHKQVLNGVAVDSEACWRFEEREASQTAVRFHLDITPRPEAITPLGLMIATPIISVVEAGVSRMLDSSLLRLKHTLERQPDAIRK